MGRGGGGQEDGGGGGGGGDGGGGGAGGGGGGGGLTEATLSDHEQREESLYMETALQGAGDISGDGGDDDGAGGDGGDDGDGHGCCLGGPEPQGLVDHCKMEEMEVEYFGDQLPSGPCEWVLRSDRLWLLSVLTLQPNFTQSQRHELEVCWGCGGGLGSPPLDVSLPELEFDNNPPPPQQQLAQLA
ncbi:uncharacterized protein LOC144953435 [Lampetra fluviatilis]